MGHGLLRAHRALDFWSPFPELGGREGAGPHHRAAGATQEGRITGPLERQGWTDGGGDGQGEETQT